MGNRTFKELVAESERRYAAMSPEQQEAMWKAQRDGYVKAEMSWPKPKFHWEIQNGVRTKVYHLMEDFYNG